MWKKGTSTNILPAIDDTSSANYVYLYRNFVEKQREPENENSEPDKYYEFEFIKVKRDVYEYIKELLNVEDRTSSIEDTLAELLFGGDDSNE